MFDLKIPLDGWLCVWNGGYEANAKLIENPDEAVDYFTTDLGFSEPEIVEILHLEDGDYWDCDPNGLMIFKMNRRLSGHEWAMEVFYPLLVEKAGTEDSLVVLETINSNIGWVNCLRAYDIEPSEDDMNAMRNTYKGLKDDN